ncbi:hypothetical protein ANN_21542 [Periplaneta americana]|uniref:Uncharacterized protein n=1 Tax=Periplaneta americana TaxID=6978 RepID=A0ABQ8S646_PERAM|nr:hypothetical protein ANN_21542 [Periplaneta americana]
MAGLCEGGNELPGSLEAICKKDRSGKQTKKSGKKNGKGKKKKGLEISRKIGMTDRKDRKNWKDRKGKQNAKDEWESKKKENWMAKEIGMKQTGKTDWKDRSGKQNRKNEWERRIVKKERADWIFKQERDDRPAKAKQERRIGKIDRTGKSKGRTNGKAKKKGKKIFKGKRDDRQESQTGKTDWKDRSGKQNAKDEWESKKEGNTGYPNRDDRPESQTGKTDWKDRSGKQTKNYREGRMESKKKKYWIFKKG